MRVEVGVRVRVAGWQVRVRVRVREMATPGEDEEVGRAS